MTDLPHVIAGQPRTEEIMRIVDDYRRTHDATREALTAAQCNAAIAL